MGVVGGEAILSVMDPYPNREMADAICCDITEGNFFTNVRYGKSQKYPGQYNYICTEYVPSGSTAPQIMPGNSSTNAGKSERPPPPDPKCTQKKTKVDCLGAGTTGSPCAWTSDTCSYTPPLDCGGFSPSNMGPFCV